MCYLLHLEVFLFCFFLKNKKQNPLHVKLEESIQSRGRRPREALLRPARPWAQTHHPAHPCPRGWGGGMQLLPLHDLWPHLPTTIPPQPYKQGCRVLFRHHRFAAPPPTPQDMASTFCCLSCMSSLYILDINIHNKIYFVYFGLSSYGIYHLQISFPIQ